jgi:hypothetical protein
MFSGKPSGESGNGSSQYVWLRTRHKQVLPQRQRPKQRNQSRESESRFLLEICRFWQKFFLDRAAVRQGVPIVAKGCLYARFPA